MAEEVKSVDQLLSQISEFEKTIKGLEANVISLKKKLEENLIFHIVYLERLVLRYIILFHIMKVDLTPLKMQYRYIQLAMILMVKIHKKGKC